MLFLLFITEYARSAFFFTFFPFWVVNYLGFPVTIAGFAISAQYLTETGFKTFAGWKFDRLGRPVLVGGLALSLLSLLLLKSWPVPPVMIVAAGLFGLGFSPLWPGVISKVAPSGIFNRATRISMVFAAWLAGAGSGMVSVNFIMARNYDFVFWLVITLWFSSLFLAWFATEKNSVAPGVERSVQNNILQALKKLATNKITISILFPGMFFQTLAAGLLLPVLPLFVQHHLHLNHNQYGLLLMAGGVTAIVSLVPLGYLADRVALKLLLGTGFSLSSLLLAYLATRSTATEAFVLAACLGFSYAMILPAWNSLLAKIIPPDSQATGWGLFATIEGLGITIGPTLGSLVARSIGMPATLLTTTGVLLAAACFYFFYPLEKVLSGK